MAGISKSARAADLATLVPDPSGATDERMLIQHRRTPTAKKTYALNSIACRY